MSKRSKHTTYLTSDEHDLIIKLGQCAYYFADIVGDDDNLMSVDSREFTDKIHQLQHTVMSQAAARLYPDRYRLLGESIFAEKDK